LTYKTAAHESLGNHTHSRASTKRNLLPSAQLSETLLKVLRDLARLFRAVTIAGLTTHKASLSPLNGILNRINKRRTKEATSLLELVKDACPSYLGYAGCGAGWNRNRRILGKRGQRPRRE
jgi:hypothetical protein